MAQALVLQMASREADLNRAVQSGLDMLRRIGKRIGPLNRGDAVRHVTGRDGSIALTESR
jgi:hypothetical protein